MGRLTHTVSGSIATVRSPAVAPIESLKVHFSPIQEGTGDPSPSNVRPITGWTGITGYHTGINVFNQEDLLNGYIYAGGGSSSLVENDYFVSTPKIYCANKTVVLVNFKEIPNVSVKLRCKLFSGSSVYTSEYSASNNGDGRTCSGAVLNPSLNVEYIAFSFFTYNNDDLKEKIEDVCVTLYDKMPSDIFYDYIPYSGETIPVTFPAVGKNLFNKDAEPYQTGKYITDSVSGIPQYSNNAVYNVYRIPIKPAKTYTFGPIKGGSSGSGPIWATMNANGITTRYIFNAGGSEGKYHTFTSYSSDAYLLLSVAVTNDYGYKCDDILQVEEGSSATTYEAFDNTIYGGYVDLATGDVYKEYKRIIYDGSEDENWGKLTSGSATAFGMYMGASDKEKALYSDISSNYLKTISHNATWGNYDNWISDNVSEIATGIQSITTVSAWKEYLSEHNLVVCYKLKTPLKIATLTPQELATFKGYSNFWSNAGDVDVTYQVVESSEMTKERQKIFAGNAPTIHTASGSVANFNMEPGLNRNLKSCKVGFLPVQEGSGDPFPPINQNGSIVGVNNLHNESELSSFKIHFSPIQSGSGDPSPSNVRPITGWTGVTGYKGGKNLFDISVPFENPDNTTFTASGTKRIFTPYTYCNGITGNNYFNANNVTSSIENGALTVSTSSMMYGTGFAIPVKGGVTYKINFTASNSNWRFEVGFYEDDGTFISFIYGSVTNAFQTPDNCSMAVIVFNSTSQSESVTYSNIQLELGSTSTSYEAYSAPTSYPVSWESYGTIYGGYVDLVSGDVVATMLYKKQRVGDSYVDATYENTKRIDVLLDSDCLSKANGTTSNTISSYFTYAYNNLDNPHFYLTDPNRIRCFVPINIDDNTEIEFACTLLNPIIVTTLTPTQMALATGKFSYWSNADVVTVETAGNVRPIKGWGKINAYSSDENLASNISNWSNMQNDNGCWKNTNVDTKQYFHCVVQLFNNSTYLKTVSEKAIKTIGANSIEFSIDVDNCTRIVLKHSGSARDLSLSISSNSIFSQGNYTIGFNVVSINSNVIGGLKISDIIMCPTSNYNICSITFPIQGKNLCPPLIKGKGVHANAGTEISANNIAVSDYIPVNFANNQNYYLSGLLYSYQSFVAAYNINKQYLGRCGGAQRSNLSITDSIFTVSTTQETGDIAFLRVEQYNITNMADIDDAKIQLEVGSSATAYEPYDNTILGGYVDLVTGEVWKTFGKSVIKSNPFSWWSAGDTVYSIAFLSDKNSYSEGKRKPGSVIYSNMMTPIGGNIDPQKATDFSEIRYYGNDIRYPIYLYIANPGRLPIADWKKMFDDTYGENEYVVYELETPVLVATLTPTQIQALKGTNNILSDANGTIEVKYWSH